MSEALVIYFILKLPIIFKIGIILMVLGVLGFMATMLIHDRAPRIVKRWLIGCGSAVAFGLFFVLMFPSERQANIMAIAYAGFEGIEAVKEMTGDSEITKNSIEAYNTMLKEYIEEHSTEAPK